MIVIIVNHISSKICKTHGYKTYEYILMKPCKSGTRKRVNAYLWKRVKHLFYKRLNICLWKRVKHVFRKRVNQDFITTSKTCEYVVFSNVWKRVNYVIWKRVNYDSENVWIRRLKFLLKTCELRDMKTCELRPQKRVISNKLKTGESRIWKRVNYDI